MVPSVDDSYWLVEKNLQIETLRNLSSTVALN